MRLWGSIGSVFLSDEELGKKDDDHKPVKLPLRNPQWTPARVPPRKTFKRLALVLLVGLAVYVFVKNMPTDVPIRDRRRPVYEHPEESRPFQPLPVKTKSRTHTKHAAPETEPETAASNNYNGPVKFLNLAESLHAIFSTRGGFTLNKNVLFAASNLKSAAAILPLACQMGSELRSYVHFALMSRSEIAIEELRVVNGIDDSCQVIFHDARPDRSAISTEARLESSASRALFHINAYMHPQAIIIDASSTEESFFLRATRTQAHSMGVPVIELPANSQKRLAWMTKLDSSSLAAWNKVNIDILIHAYAGASGSLIRLLKSLTAADFTSCAIPHLTIELPHNIDPPTLKFLESFQWPPVHVENPTNVRQLSLRHRIPRRSLTEEESSVRFLESFWPASPLNSHILVLSPQTELSSQFFHYLKYSVLEYKHSAVAQFQEWDARLLGISLDLPSTYLNASEPFSAPSKKDVDKTAGVHGDGPTSFLWQAPNSNAVLFFGQKWMELHGFVSHLVDALHKAHIPLLSEKSVSKMYPSWLEHALRLARARGYWTLYPSAGTATNLASIHKELYKPPEEYEMELEKDSKDTTEITLASKPLIDSLPNEGVLPPFDELPILAWDGKLLSLSDFDFAASEYAAELRRAIGGCEDLAPSDLSPKSTASDLFCTRDS